MTVVTTGDFESVISFLSTTPSIKGCFQIETNDGSQIEFHDQTTIDGESNLGIRIISPNALNNHFDNTDKRCLFIDSSKNLSKDILSLYELLKPEFPEFITREGQPLTPHIIPSASS